MEEQYKDIERLIKEAGIEHPSSGFLKNVMNRIEVEENSTITPYKPLISNIVWMVIVLVVVALVSGILFLSDSNSSFPGKKVFSFLDSISIKNPLSGYTFHATAMYGLLFLALLFFIQIPILKRRIDRSFEI